MKRYMAVNIGSNSSKVLIADCNIIGDNVYLNKVFTDVVVTGIGRNVRTTGKLTNEGIESTIKAVSCFVEKGEFFNVDDVWITATEAARISENSHELVNEVKCNTGYDLDIISDDKESKLALAGVLSTELVQKTVESGFVVIDSGGASTELITVKDDIFADENILTKSLKMGAATLTQEFIFNDPPTADEYMRMCQHIKGLLECVETDFKKKTKKFYGIGGAATILAALKWQTNEFDEDIINGTEITLKECGELLKRTISLPHESRKSLSGMINSNRALTVPAGIAIFYQCMKFLNAEKIIISIAGILEGMIINMVKSKTM